MLFEVINNCTACAVTVKIRTLSVPVADLGAAGQTPDRRRCSRCNSSVYVVHTRNLSDSLALHRLVLGASGVAEDTGRSSDAVWTEDGLGTRSPDRQEDVVCLDECRISLSALISDLMVEEKPSVFTK